jgi:hypothetical protein
MAELLKEAIADAKAVREVALQNAKMALEEAFDSKIKNMLSARLAEELEEDVELEEEYIEEEAEATDEGYDYEEDDKVKEVDDSIEEDIDEEINLDELMAELEEMGSYEEDDKVDEAYEEDDKVDEAEEDPKRAAAIEKLEKALAENDTEINEVAVASVLAGVAGLFAAAGGMTYLEMKMKDPEWRKAHPKIAATMSVLQDMGSIASKARRGSGTASGPNTMGESVDIDALIAEIEADLEEGKKKDDEEALEERKRRKKAEADKEEADKKLKEALATVSSLKETISEMNLLNSKLLYCNKLFRANALTEAQKVKVVDALDKSTTASEAKLVFETLQESFNFTGVEKRAIKEGLGRASKASGTAPKKVLAESVDETVSRFQKLANINK